MFQNKITKISPARPANQHHQGDQGLPFTSVEEAWFWFMCAQQARADGARVAKGQGAVPRPCEPIDILRVLDRLHRQRLLMNDHLLVLRHYGRRLMAPDPRRVKEGRAAILWREAMDHLETALLSKGIVAARRGWCDRLLGCKIGSDHV